MDRRRTILWLAAAAAFVVGVAEIASVRIVPGTPDEALLTLLGVVPLLLAYAVARTRRQDDVEWTPTPDPERRARVGTPGDDFGRTLASISGTRGRYAGAAARWQLRDVAAEVIANYGSESIAEARARVEAGAWTDNPVAAAFLGDHGRVPLAARARSLLSAESAVDRRIRETVDEIAAIAGLEFGADDGRVGWLDGWLARRLDADGDEPSERDPLPTGAGTDRWPIDRATNHWLGVGALALACAGVGVLARSPGVALTGVVGIGLAAYARAGGTPTADLAIDRQVEETQPGPGDTVRVTVTVENRGERPAPDVRVVDGVPAGLTVADGSPRLGTALRAGESAEFSYRVTAARGRHEFGPALALVGDFPGSHQRELALVAETTVVCRPRPVPVAAPYPLRRRATRFAGRMATAESGPGTEFFGTREYRRGDPPGRIDWNRRARTGEFATLEFRSERAARVVLVVDARPAAYRSTEPHGEHSVDRAADAAGRLFAAMDDDGHRVGLAALGPDPCWLAPDSGADHRQRFIDLLGTHPALASEPPSGNTYVRRWLAEFRERVPGDVQPLLVTPLTDDSSANVARTLEASDYPVSVLSPDPTAERTPGHRLARVGRQLRVAELRRAGIPVANWGPEEPLEAALERHGERR